MENRTTLVPVSANNESLTSFSEDKDYSAFKEKTMGFVRNNTSHARTHIPHFDDESFNYFLSGASVLFKQLHLIQTTYDIGSVHEVREAFIDNINAYTQSVSAYEVEESQVLVSRYILCSVIDELVNTTFFGRDNNWSSNSLLNIFHNESYGGENFFKLLDKFLKAPAKYIYLLELMYVCMSIGFEGKYRVNPTKKHELTMIKDGLYKQIKIIQGRESMKFYTKQKVSELKHRLFYMFSYNTIFLSAFCLILVIYLGFSMALSSQDGDFNDAVNGQFKNLTYLNSDNFDIDHFVKEDNE